MPKVRASGCEKCSKDLLYIEYKDGEAYVRVNCTMCGDRVYISVDRIVEAAVLLGKTLEEDSEATPEAILESLVSPSTLVH